MVPLAVLGWSKTPAGASTLGWWRYRYDLDGDSPMVAHCTWQTTCLLPPQHSRVACHVLKLRKLRKVSPELEVQCAWCMPASFGAGLGLFVSSLRAHCSNCRSNVGAVTSLPKLQRSVRHAMQCERFSTGSAESSGCLLLSMLTLMPSLTRQVCAELRLCINPISLAAAGAAHDATSPAEQSKSCIALLVPPLPCSPTYSTNVSTVKLG